MFAPGTEPGDVGGTHFRINICQMHSKREPKQKQKQNLCDDWRHALCLDGAQEMGKSTLRDGQSGQPGRKG